MLNEICDMFFYIIKMTVSLYSLYYIYYIKVAVFFRVMVPLNTVPYLFFQYMKFSSRYGELFLHVFQDARDYIEFLGI